MQIVLDVSEFQSVAQLDQLLTNADDEIVGVYIKATQGLTYSDALAESFAGVCMKHKTAFGYYDFLTNDQIDQQQQAFKTLVSGLRDSPSLIPMLDAEGSYDKFADGVSHWVGAKLLYAQLSNMPKYGGLTVPKWVAQYDQGGYYRPQPSEIAAYVKQGYALWQWTDSYMGYNQDASVLLGSLSALKVVP